MAWKTKEEAKAYNDAYRLRNRERILEQKRDAYAAEPDKFRKARADWRKANPNRALQSELKYQAKLRAAQQGVPFSITLDDIIVPEFCPALGIRLERNTGGCAHNASPTLDKIIPSLGYVVGNIAVISHKANTIKGPWTVEELRAVLKYACTEEHDNA